MNGLNDFTRTYAPLVGRIMIATKNIGFVGGLLVILGLGAGPLSIDNRRSLEPVRGA